MTRFRLTKKIEAESGSGAIGMPGMPSAATPSTVASIEVQLVDADGVNVPGTYPVTLTVGAASDFASKPIGTILYFAEPL